MQQYFVWQGLAIAGRSGVPGSNADCMRIDEGADAAIDVGLVGRQSQRQHGIHAGLYMTFVAEKIGDAGLAPQRYIQAI